MTSSFLQKEIKFSSELSPLYEAPPNYPSLEAKIANKLTAKRANSTQFLSMMDPKINGK